MFKITIEQKEPVRTTKKSYEKIADTGNPHDKGAMYGYVAVDVVEIQSKTIYEQAVDVLDLPAVIKAINKL